MVLVPPSLTWSIQGAGQILLQLDQNLSIRAAGTCYRWWGDAMQDWTVKVGGVLKTIWASTRPKSWWCLMVLQPIFSPSSAHLHRWGGCGEGAAIPPEEHYRLGGCEEDSTRPPPSEPPQECHLKDEAAGGVLPLFHRKWAHIAGVFQLCHGTKMTLQRVVKTVRKTLQTPSPLPGGHLRASWQSTHPGQSWAAGNQSTSNTTTTLNN